MVGVFGMFIAVVVILTTCVHPFQLPTKRPNLKRHILYSSIQIADVSALVSESQLTANVLMSCVMAGIGDTVAQVQTQKQNKGGEYNLENLDKKRLKNFILKGFGSGILWSYYYCFIRSMVYRICSVARYRTRRCILHIIIYDDRSISLESHYFLIMGYSVSFITPRDSI